MCFIVSVALGFLSTYPGYSIESGSPRTRPVPSGDPLEKPYRGFWGSLRPLLLGDYLGNLGRDQPGTAYDPLMRVIWGTREQVCRAWADAGVDVFFGRPVWLSNRA